LTIAGLQWAELVPGRRLEIGEVAIELAGYAHPCANIAEFFHDRNASRVSQKVYPGWSRLYARVVKEGTVRVGDPVRMVRAEASVA
jgi:MOSC domain-containing protein YiiM